MIPESRLIRSEVIIRELALPDDVLLARKSLIRWIALSMGMIMPNESRRLLLDILEVIFDFHLRNQTPTTVDIVKKLEEFTQTKQNLKAVYYHLQRLTEYGILSRKKGRYYLGNGEGKNLREIFREFYIKKAESAFSNMGTALDKLESNYR